MTPVMCQAKSQKGCRV